MITLNQDKLKAVIEAYKKYFPTNIGKEIYKWKAVKSFQDKWNLEAENFSEMFYNSTKDADNLLGSKNRFPRRMIRELAVKDPEIVRNMFRNLYDESLDLSGRAESFISASEKLVKEYFPGKMHYQDYNAISTYLWLRYPNKYYIYKYTEIRKVTTTLETNFVIKKGADINSVLNTFALYDEIAEILKADSSIRSMLNAVLTADCDKDENLHSVVVDLGYFISRYYSPADQVQPSPDKVKIWLIAPGEGAKMWEDCLANKRICLGWDDMGDLSQFESRDDMRAKMKEIWGPDGTYSNDSLATWEFVNEMNIGDVIYVKKGRTGIIGKGIITGDYQFDNSLVEYKNVRSVDWTVKGEWHTQDMFAMKTLTEITQYKDFLAEIERLIKGETPNTETYTDAEFLNEVYMTKEKLAELKTLVKTKKNVILQGAPGVGKTFCAERLAYTIMGEKDESRVCLIQFHQNYSYEDFIMGYKPTENGFELVPGKFYTFCRDAAADSNRDYFFIIDEINRGNLSKIFGELLMLIENSYRGKPLVLAYKDESFYVPSNVYIIGMMNTADRSLAMIDYALRRRFSFFEMTPGFDSDGFKAYMSKWENLHFEKLIGAVKELNKAIASDDSLGTGFEIGHSYFCGCKECTDSWLKSVVNYDIIPMLQEYWFDNKNEAQKWGAKLLAAIND